MNGYYWKLSLQCHCVWRVNKEQWPWSWPWHYLDFHHCNSVYCWTPWKCFVYIEILEFEGSPYKCRSTHGTWAAFTRLLRVFLQHLRVMNEPLYGRWEKHMRQMWVIFITLYTAITRSIPWTVHSQSHNTLCCWMEFDIRTIHDQSHHWTTISAQFLGVICWRMVQDCMLQRSKLH